MARFECLKRTVLLLGLFILSATNVWAIKKCQDSDGKWHYGDFAVQACSESKVTTLDDRGFVKEEKAAPLTNQEKEAQEEALRIEREQQAKEQAEREERNRILSIYETEADIERQRDNQLYSIQSNIDVTKAYIKSLNESLKRHEAKMAGITNTVLKEKAEADRVEIAEKISSAEKQLLDIHEQKLGVEKKFERELDLYRNLRKNTG